MRREVSHGLAKKSLHDSNRFFKELEPFALDSVSSFTTVKSVFTISLRHPLLEASFKPSTIIYISVSSIELGPMLQAKLETQTPLQSLIKPLPLVIPVLETKAPSELSLHQPTGGQVHLTIVLCTFFRGFKLFLKACSISNHNLWMSHHITAANFAPQSLPREGCSSWH